MTVPAVQTLPWATQHSTPWLLQHLGRLYWTDPSWCKPPIWNDKKLFSFFRTGWETKLNQLRWVLGDIFFHTFTFRGNIKNDSLDLHCIWCDRASENFHYMISVISLITGIIRNLIYDLSLSCWFLTLIKLAFFYSSVSERR